MGDTFPEKFGCFLNCVDQLIIGCMHKEIFKSLNDMRFFHDADLRRRIIRCMRKQNGTVIDVKFHLGTKSLPSGKDKTFFFRLDWHGSGAAGARSGLQSKKDDSNRKEPDK